MSERRYDVSLSETRVGTLSAHEDGRVAFRFDDGYRDDPERPILGQHFEDDLAKTYTGNAAGALPGFFANLLPEGALRDVLLRSLGDRVVDDASLLAALGDDLPGAVIVRPVGDAAAASATPSPAPASPGPSDDEAGLRFSLAGVQLKFSMLSQGDQLTLPGHGEHGDWIVKLGSTRFEHLIENEHATMEWARACGFDVPECRLHPPDALTGLPRRHAPEGSPVLAIRRFDREPGGARTHQEDFAQVLGRTRARFDRDGRYKYDEKVESVAVIVKTIVGEDAYLEIVRRVAFVLASGNHDAHIKNWSLRYPDGRTPTLSPLYDQTCTVAWPDHDRVLALKLAGTRQPGEVDDACLRRLARKVGADETDTLEAAKETIARTRETWRTDMAPRLAADAHREALVEHWKRVPILRSVGALS